MKQSPRFVSKRDLLKEEEAERFKTEIRSKREYSVISFKKNNKKSIGHIGGYSKVLREKQLCEKKSVPKGHSKKYSEISVKKKRGSNYMEFLRGRE